MNWRDDPEVQPYLEDAPGYGVDYHGAAAAAVNAYKRWLTSEIETLIQENGAGGYLRAMHNTLALIERESPS